MIIERDWDVGVLIGFCGLCFDFDVVFGMWIVGEDVIFGDFVVENIIIVVYFDFVWEFYYFVGVVKIGFVGSFDVYIGGVCCLKNCVVGGVEIVFVWYGEFDFGWLFVVGMVCDDY